jgi:gas vesicle protein
MSKLSDTFSFLIGVTVGVVAGAVTGVLLAPKSGTETQKEIKEFAGNLSTKVEEYTLLASKTVNKKVKALQELGTKIDQTKYKLLVDEVIAELKADGRLTAEVSNKISLQLKRDWKKVQVAVTK